MFKTGSFEDEIYRSMETKLVSNQLENKFSFDKISKAADYLNAAASLFDKAGMYSEAAEVTEVLQGLSKQLGKTSVK
jgi:hypothetical protein